VDGSKLTLKYSRKTRKEVVYPCSYNYYKKYKKWYSQYVKKHRSYNLFQC